MSTVTPIDPAAERDTLTLYDLARLWGVSYTTVYEQARANTLPVPVIRVGRRYLVSRKVYEQVMNARHEPDAKSA